jgi:predicted aldo/keto reductase-like oxidoreductase
VTSVVNSKTGVDPHYQDLAASAVQEKLGRTDRTLLLRYATALSPEYCRGCAGSCTDACPGEVGIPHVLQFAMYDRDYGWHDQARDHYRALPLEQRFSDACLSCNECTGACPFGVDAADGVRAARQRLG